MTAFVVALVVALAATPAVAALVRHWQLIDVPNHRSSHATPVPRGGGLAVAAATVIGVVAAAVWSRSVAGLVIGALVLGAVGLADDWLGLRAEPRLAAQVLTPMVIAVALLDRDGWELAAAVVVAVVVITGYVNAFNFMDGINGISALQTIVAGCVLAAICADVGADALAACGWAVAGAALGFLPFNAVRPRLFLGDVGSYFLGFWLVGLAVLAAEAGAPVLVVAAPFLLYVADTGTVLVRRARRGERLTEAHREHAYQRLTQLGYPHIAVAAACAAVSACCSALMWLTRDSKLIVQGAVLVACGVIVGLYLAAPSVLESRATHEGLAAS